MRKFALMVLLVLLYISVLRTCFSDDFHPLTLAGLLDILSSIDISFANLVSTITSLDTRFIVEWSSTWYENIGLFFDVLLKSIVTPFEFIFSLVADLFNFVKSVLNVFIQLLGFNPF